MGETWWNLWKSTHPKSKSLLSSLESTNGTISSAAKCCRARSPQREEIGNGTMISAYCCVFTMNCRKSCGQPSLSSKLDLPVACLFNHIAASPRKVSIQTKQALGSTKPLTCSSPVLECNLAKAEAIRMLLPPLNDPTSTKNCGCSCSKRAYKKSLGTLVWGYEWSSFMVLLEMQP